jgi:hypothetical protein
VRKGVVEAGSSDGGHAGRRNDRWTGGIKDGRTEGVVKVPRFLKFFRIHFENILEKDGSLATLYIDAPIFKCSIAVLDTYEFDFSRLTDSWKGKV